MSRREARESAFKLLYQMEFRDDDPTLQRAVFLEEYPLSSDDVEYFDLVVLGVSEHKKQLDEFYAPLLKGWKIERLAKVDLVLLRIATYEITMCPQIPVNVSISEAVILTKRYSTEESKNYINAVLGKISPGDKT